MHVVIFLSKQKEYKREQAIACLERSLAVVSLHTAVAQRKPPVREQRVQPQGFLPMPLSLQPKAADLTQQKPQILLH